MESLTAPQIENIFKEIDQDHDGFITKHNLLASSYSLSIFDNHPVALSVPSSPTQSFDSFPEGKMNLADFTMLCHGARYNVYNFVVAKFNAAKYLNKYLLVSAPGEAAPSIKQSYIRLKVQQ